MPSIARTGNEAMAEAMRQINPDVVAAYPITPATEIVMIFAGFVSNGKVDTEYVPVESEHSAMSACVGAAAAGARVMTGTSSQGLQLMSEILPIASALRLPIIICEVNRALSGPINIHCDHSDTMAVRDFGWIQIFAENSQEAYDSVIQTLKVAEKIELPAMVSTDGFIISHCMEKIDILEDKEVQAFIGEKQFDRGLLEVDKPKTMGCLDLQDYYFEHKRPVAEAMNNASQVILEVAEEFKNKFGRSYGLIEAYQVENAERVIVAMGSTCGTARVVVDELREKGEKVGLLKIRVFRPFPAKEIAAALSKVKAVALLDRVDSFSSQASPTFTEVASALYDSKSKPKMVNYIYGLGGREIGLEDIKKVFEELNKVDKLAQVNYLGLRE